MKSHFLCLALIIVGAAVFSSPVSAEQLDKHLPADSVAYISWAGRGLVFDGSMFGQMIQDPEVQELLALVYDTIDSNIPASEVDTRKIFKNAWPMAAMLWECPMAVAVTPDDDVMGVILLIDLGKKQPEFKKQIDELIALNPKAAAPVTVGAYQYQPLPKNALLGEVAYGFKGEIFFVTLGKGQAKALLERDAIKSLATNKKYQDCTKTVRGKNEQISLYVDVAKIMAIAEAKLDKLPTIGDPPKFRKIVDALGVGKLSAAAGSICVVDKGMHTKIKLFTPAPHQGVLLPLAGRALTEKDIAVIPADADFAIVMNISAEKIYNEVFRVARQFDPQSDEMMVSMIAGMEETLGIALVDGVLKTLGDTWIISSAASQGGLLTGTVMSVEVKDPETLKKSLAAIEVYASAVLKNPHLQYEKNPQIRKQKMAGIEVSYLHAPNLKMVLPAWAIHKNRLYLAAWPQVIVSTINNQTPPLAGDKEFKRLRGHLKADASGMIYINTPQLTKTFYAAPLLFGTAMVNAASEQLPEGFLDNGPMPYWPIALSTILKYTWAEVDTISHDETGITFEAYGSNPVSMAAAPVVAGGTVAVMLPALHRAKHLAKSTVSKCNLRGVGLGLAMYASDYDDQHPEHLGLLVEGDYIEPGMLDMLKSPLSNNPAPQYDPKTKKLTGLVDYTYIYYKTPAGEQPDPAGLLVMYENPELLAKDRIVNCLFADCHVEQVPVSKFRELLKKSLEAGGVQTPKPGEAKPAPAKPKPGAAKSRKRPRRGGRGPMRDMHYWDITTNKEVVLKPEDFKKGKMGPGIMMMDMGLSMNPKTGEKTLLSMRHCPSCKKYYLPKSYEGATLDDFDEETGMLLDEDGEPVMIGLDPKDDNVCPHCGTDAVEWYRANRKPKKKK
ncbi:MAG: hypothetical protein KAR11_00435 [Phycisphaerae bacterium]|nr:hypothetical protein [Phycisphaerae bacterium]